MMFTRALFLAASLSLLVISGCAGGTGFYTGGDVYVGSAYGYPAWPGDIGPPYLYGLPLYGGWAPPGPFIGPPVHPRAFYRGYRHYPRAFGDGPRWGGPRHFRR
jgi:hypothetical protein